MPAHKGCNITWINLQDTLIFRHRLLCSTQFLQGQSVIEAGSNAGWTLLQCLLKLRQRSIHIAQAQIRLGSLSTLAQQIFLITMRSQQINQAHAIGQVVRLKLQHAPIRSDGILDPTIDDVGIDQNSIFRYGLLDLALTYIDFAQNLMYIQILRSHIDNAQTFLDSRSE